MWSLLSVCQLSFLWLISATTHTLWSKVDTPGANLNIFAIREQYFPPFPSRLPFTYHWPEQSTQQCSHSGLLWTVMVSLLDFELKYEPWDSQAILLAQLAEGNGSIITICYWFWDMGAKNDNWREAARNPEGAWVHSQKRNRGRSPIASRNHHCLQPENKKTKPLLNPPERSMSMILDKWDSGLAREMQNCNKITSVLSYACSKGKGIHMATPKANSGRTTHSLDQLGICLGLES